MVAQAEKELGAVDILVNNAGIQYTAPVELLPTDKWDAIIAITLLPHFMRLKPHSPDGSSSRGFGRIINIASAHGLEQAA